MAKKSPAPKVNVDSEDESAARDGNESAIVEFEANPPPLTIIPQGVDVAKLVQYGLDNDPFNQWEPELDESKILQLRGIKRIFLEKQDFDGLLCRFLDVSNGKTVYKFLGEHIVKEMVDNRIHETGLPVLLTYGGKVRGRRREGQEVHNWMRYYYTATEWKTLTTPQGA